MITVKPEENKTKLKILIAGRTASGKDYLAKELTNKGLTQLKSHTTRPKRSANEDNHTFITEAEYKLLDWAGVIAHTEINGHKYFATKKDLLNSEVYIVDINGIKQLLKNMPDTPMIVVYVRANEKDRKEQFIKRSGLAEDIAEKEFNERNESETKQFDEFEKLLETGNLSSIGNNFSSIHFTNNYEPETITGLANYIMAQIHIHNEFMKLTKKAIEINMLKTNEDGDISVTVTKDNESIKKYDKIEMFALKVTTDDELAGRLLNDVLSRGVSLGL